MKSVIAMSFFLASASAACDYLKVQATGYTLADSQGLGDITYFAEFTLSCSNDEKPVLWADIEETFHPVVTSANGMKYKVIWINELKKVPSGNITVDLYDTEGLVATKRARSRGDASTTAPLVTFVVTYPASVEPTVKPAPSIPSILIGVCSGLTAGVSNEFVLGAILKMGTHPYNNFAPHNVFSPRQELALTMTCLGSCVVSVPVWLSLKDAPKQLAFFGALITSAGLILLGPLPFHKPFATTIIGVVLHEFGQVASMVGAIAYATGEYFFFAMLLGFKVGEPLFKNLTITKVIRIIVFMEMVSILLISF